MTRSQFAYTIPSAIFTGLATHEILGCLLLLFTMKSKRNSQYRLACFCLILIVLCLAVNCVTLDYVASPYLNPFFINPGYIAVSAYIMNALTTIAIISLFILRIALFYGTRSFFFRFMLIFGIFVIAVKIMGDAIGMYISYTVAIGRYPDFTHNPEYAWEPLVLAFAEAFEAIFSALGSISFVCYLTDFNTDLSLVEIMDKVPLLERLRVFFILGIHSVVFCFGVWNAALGDNYINHTAFYIVPFVHAIELHFFLDLSYKSSDAILGQLEGFKTRKSILF